MDFLGWTTTKPLSKQTRIRFAFFSLFCLGLSQRSGNQQFGKPLLKKTGCFRLKAKHNKTTFEKNNSEKIT